MVECRDNKKNHRNQFGILFLTNVNMKQKKNEFGLNRTHSLKQSAKNESKMFSFFVLYMESAMLL